MTETLQNLYLGFSVALTPSVLMYAFIGCVIGTLVGGSGVYMLKPASVTPADPNTETILGGAEACIKRQDYKCALDDALKALATSPKHEGALSILRHPEVKKEQQRQEEIRRRTIISIIEKQKPAHTVYTLNLGILSEESETAQRELAAANRANGRDQKKDEIAAQAAIWFKLDD